MRIYHNRLLTTSDIIFWRWRRSGSKSGGVAIKARKTMKEKQKEIISLRQKLCDRMREQTAMEATYQAKLLRFLDISDDAPLKDYAETIVDYAIEGGVDVKWFFTFLNNAALFVKKYSAGKSRLTGAALLEFSEKLPISAPNLISALRYMYPGGCDEPSGEYMAKELLAEGQLIIKCLENQEITGNKRRLSTVYKWLQDNTELISRLG